MLHTIFICFILWIMSEEKEIVNLSVRGLVEFMFRGGDITSGGSGVRDTDAMQMGSRIHRKIQKQMGIGYEAEVALFAVFSLTSREYGTPFDLKIEGRADGVFEKDGEVMIDEIKGMFLDVTELKEPFFVHKAQAMCYAYMVAEDRNLPSIGVQMTYCNLETEHIRRFEDHFDRNEITAWFTDLIQRYEKWAIYQYDWQRRRNASIHELVFPFPYRKGQKALAAMVYRTIEKKDKLFIQAPTGVGKTITTLFPSIKAMGEGLDDRIFYLTAKTITRTVAEECFQLLEQQGLEFKAVTLTAKEKVCILDAPSCSPEDCPYAKGHYDRVNEAVYDLLTSGEPLRRQTLATYAEKHRVCPFEFSLDVSLYADAIICDYNYVFDPTVYLRRFFPSDKQGNMIFLVDEAHNLVERAREMYSAALIKEDILAVNRILKSMERHEKRPEAAYNLRKYEKALSALNRSMLSYKRECDEFEVLEHLDAMEFQLLRVLSAYELVAKDYPVLPERETMLNFYFNARNFSRVLELLDEKYRIYADYTETGDFRIKLQCMDPSGCLKEVFERGRVRHSIFRHFTACEILQRTAGRRSAGSGGIRRFLFFTGAAESSDCPGCDQQIYQAGSGRIPKNRLLY